MGNNTESTMRRKLFLTYFFNSNYKKGENYVRKSFNLVTYTVGGKKKKRVACSRFTSENQSILLFEPFPSFNIASIG